MYVCGSCLCVLCVFVCVLLYFGGITYIELILENRRERRENPTSGVGVGGSGDFVNFANLILPLLNIAIIRVLLPLSHTISGQ